MYISQLRDLEPLTTSCLSQMSNSRLFLSLMMFLKNVRGFLSISASMGNIPIMARVTQFDVLGGSHCSCFSRSHWNFSRMSLTDVSGPYLGRHHGIETISAIQSCTEQRIHCSDCHDCSGADSLCVDGASCSLENPRDVWPSVQSPDHMCRSTLGVLSPAGYCSITDLEELIVRRSMLACVSMVFSRVDISPNSVDAMSATSSTHVVAAHSTQFQ